MNRVEVSVGEYTPLQVSELSNFTNCVPISESDHHSASGRSITHGIDGTVDLIERVMGAYELIQLIASFLQT